MKTYWTENLWQLKELESNVGLGVLWMGVEWLLADKMLLVLGRTRRINAFIEASLEQFYILSFIFFFFFNFVISYSDYKGKFTSFLSKV